MWNRGPYWLKACYPGTPCSWCCVACRVLLPLLQRRFWSFQLFQNEMNNISRTSNIAFLLDWAEMFDLYFGLIRQNISIQKASFYYQGCPLSLKSGKLWLNSYIYWISITSNWFFSQQFSLSYSKNILSVYPFRGDKKKTKKVLVNPTEFFH